MKKILVCLAMSVSMFVVSCSTPAEKSIKELEKIVLEVSRLIDDEVYYETMSKAVNPYGDGLACERIIRVF